MCILCLKPPPWVVSDGLRLTQMESVRLKWTLIDLNGLGWTFYVQLNMNGLRWTPMESDGLKWTLIDLDELGLNLMD